MIRYLIPLVFILSSSAGFAAPKVVATIQPVHAIVAYVMQDIAEPVLLLKNTASPHDYSLRPSDMRTISQADAVFWIGESFETFLAKPLWFAKAVHHVSLIRAPGIERLNLGEDRVDPHIWLDPRNAAAIAVVVSDTLSTLDPKNADAYQENTRLLLARLRVLEQEINAILEPIKTKPYIVFHDAYQYFEHRFATRAVGAITIDPERRPGARRVAEIRAKLKAGNALCVFSEPQFEPALISVLIEDTQAQHGVLDPLGSDLRPGATAYFELLTRLALSLRNCLTLE